MPLIPLAHAYSLLSPDAVARVNTATWTQQAHTFFAAKLVFVQSFTDPDGVLPERASFDLDVSPARAPDRVTRVHVNTVPLGDSPEVFAAAHTAVEAMGGAGFDALLARAKRLWQIDARVATGADVATPAVIAALLALTLTAPVVPPGGGAIFGVRGARARMEGLGWRA